MAETWRRTLRPTPVRHPIWETSHPGSSGKGKTDKPIAQTISQPSPHHDHISPLLAATPASLWLFLHRSAPSLAAHPVMERRAQCWTTKQGLKTHTEMHSSGLLQVLSVSAQSAHASSPPGFDHMLSQMLSRLQPPVPSGTGPSTEKGVQ